MKYRDLKYNLHQDVYIKPIGYWGHVEEINIGNSGISYRVAFWNNGERYSYFLDSKELSDKKDG